ncbi:hypothetical protein P3T76_002552 [Phytophthora citrophthora]|uniref:Uncharacterized protein n=1 Tax=Phytophthora citrophthora TaxID=4793 RepID=A0AAD9LSW7_9STRA|nr:hypothetical protein P3T76_002552 [Phytophthora citrophthora]
MDEEEDYELQPPAPPRRDTITRQLQREILGELNDSTKELDPEQLEHKTEEDEPLSTPSKRRTLSPSKAAQLLEDAAYLDASISRWDTASPGALKSLLQTEEASKQKSRSPDTSQKNVEEVQDSPARSTRSKTSSVSKRPRSNSKTSPKKTRDSRRDSSSLGDTSDSFTNSMFAPNLLEQDELKRATLDPVEAASVVAELQKEAWSLRDSALEMDQDTDSDKQREVDEELKKKSPSPSKKVTGKKTPTSSKKSKLLSPTRAKSKSPASSKEKTSKKSPSLAKESRSRKSPTPMKEAKSSKRSSPAIDAKTKKSPASPKSASKRRETVDPGDLLTMLEDNLQPHDDRRQTIDDNGLQELTNGLDSPSIGDSDVARKHREEASRKRANSSDAHGGTPEKRARAISSYNDVTMESMDIDSSVEETKSSPLKENQGQAEVGTGNQRIPDDLPPSRIPKPSLFSPPPGGTRIRTPLKGILSARKAQRNVGDTIQTTPNKTVNFGPSQGAEFNHGSPSTSMTPMPAKDASRLFPLERVSSEEEPDDAETSLNSSILDEADSFDEEEPKKINAQKISQQLKKPGFDLLQARRSSLMATKSTDKTQRRHSMRGYSPLDSRAEIRRRRRQTITVTRQTPKSAAATSFTADKMTPASSQSPSASRNKSFLRTTDAQTTRTPYADSSASSDAGEDMEITGEYSIVFGRGVEDTGKQSTTSSALPRDEDTAEFSLGHLLAESSVYELTKSAPEPDLHDLPGSLSDLANEVASSSSSQSSQVTNATRKNNDQDTTLDPIQEANETMTSSRNQSAMSLVSDESDEEYGASRVSLQVNLKSQFDRVSEPSQSPRRPPTPEALSVHLITMEELLSSIDLNEEETVVEAVGDFFGEDADTLDNQASKDVKLACAHDTCSEVIERHAQDVSSWTSAVAEELSSLLQIKAPAVFTPENFDDAGREAIEKLYATEAMVARTGWCQLQAQLEKQLANSLSLGADALALDVKSLKENVAADAVQRQSEIAAIKEMIEREEQMSLLLDAIEEQQGAHDEYVAAVQNLEKECSSLSLEESVLQSRLKVLEGRAAELEPVTSAAFTRFEQEVLTAEEMLTIQERLGIWKIREATSSLLRLSARFEDVLFDVEICVDAHLRHTSTGRATTSIKTNETLKRREGNTYLPYEGDIVLVLQRLLLDPHYMSRIADESELENGNNRLLCSKLQVLEHFISRSFRFLKELRELSTHFAMRYDDADSTLWVDFIKFPSVASRMDAEGSQFSVGFSLLPVFPYTDYQTVVQVSHGQVCSTLQFHHILAQSSNLLSACFLKVSTDDVAKEIELVSRTEPKYFTRVCQRLHQSFVR